ncbi:MAG: hypothetical protein IPP51_13070 [Bacteroidetes bacterium]|nr:hypothetical protein [Bacteroidota bacterium]
MFINQKYTKNGFRSLVAGLAMALSFQNANAQSSVAIQLASATNVDFTFDTFEKLRTGIFIANAITFNIEATGTRWDLYMGAVTTTPGLWDNVQLYGTSGTAPTVDMIKLRVHNLSSTPLISGFVPLQDIATSTLDIIGNHNATDVDINCSDINPAGTNTAGSYTTDPQCYQFRVDLRIVPGTAYTPGLYTLQIEFVIAPDL